ncbi:MAG TPA: polyphosphate polymerase domain-containing protein [Crenotrichaceae bacterium]|nr:polyphosphate polymerase domain-containing protein [Crenotrichaceae bacterium]
MTVIHTLPPVLERYELKYLIPWSYVEPITDFLGIYCSLDYYSEIVPENNYFYKISSLYFDSPGYEFLRQRIEGKAIRFNMRVRAYGDGKQAPYFLEVKHRTGISGVVKKYRATAQEYQWPEILTDPGFRPSESDTSVEIANKELFLRLAIGYAIEPKIVTKYERIAFFSTVDEYARVTMDANLQYRVENDYIIATDYGMTNYDNETIFANNTRSEGSVVLELKCNVGEVPYWMLDLIRRFELQNVGFSKYVNSTLVSYYDNGDRFMPFDRDSGRCVV